MNAAVLTLATATRGDPSRDAPAANAHRDAVYLNVTPRDITPRDATTRDAAPRGDDTAAAGALDLACRIGPGAALLLGRHEGRLPRDGEAVLGADGERRGRFRAVAWPREDGAGVWYLAALRLAAEARHAPGEPLSVTGQGGALPLGAMPADAALPDALVAALRARLPARRGAAVARFLFDVTAPAALSRPGPARDALWAILAAVAVPDGAAEMVGGVPGVLGFVQGWGLPAAEGSELLLRRTDGTLERVPGREAAFARADIPAPAGGVVHLLPAPTGPVAPPAELLVAAPDGTLLRRAAIAGRAPLSPVESAGHLRDVMPRLRCDAESLALVRRALRPLYNGTDTLWSGAHPVRAAVDLLADCDGGGLYLHGWVFDPQHAARTVWLRGAAGYAARLDAGWTRIERPDVGAGIVKDPRLAALVDSSTEHGFAAILPPLPAPQALHLEFDFADTDCAFVPLSAPTRGAPALRRALAGVDLHKPSGEAIVERQLGPLVLARLGAPPARPAAETLVAARSAGAVAVSVLVPLPDPGEAVAAFLSQFMADPLLADEELVFALSGRWSGSDLGRLRRRLEFDGLGAVLVRTADGTADAATLLDLAAGVARAETLLCLAPSVFGRAPGWRGALRAALAAGEGAAAAIPTAVHEDFAVRSAGIESVRPLDVAPYVALHHLGAGLPVAAVPDRLGSVARPVATAGSLRCCLLPAAATREAGGFGGGHLLEQAQALDFFARLRARAGVGCVWVPEAEVYALEEPPEPHGWERAALLADGWALRAGLIETHPAGTSHTKTPEA